MREADRQMRQVIADLVAIHLPPDPLTVNWQGAEGRAIADDAIHSAYSALAALDESDPS
jgi:hypothetical protein